MSHQTLLHFPKTIAEAGALLSRDGDRRCLAGGGLVVPHLAAGPSKELISLRRIAVLQGIVETQDGVRINAMACHADVARSDLLRGGLGVVRQAAAEIGHPAIRNMATIGGTVCRANPAADYASALLAAGAIVHLAGVEGAHAVPIDRFTLGDGVTARHRNEIVTAVTLPPDPGAGSAGYARFSRVDGDYPVATAAVRLAWHQGRVTTARVAVGGCAATAYRCAGGEARLLGLAAETDVPAGLLEDYVAHAAPTDDLKGSAEYRLLLIPGLLRRAIRQALAGGANTTP